MEARGEGRNPFHADANITRYVLGRIALYSGDYATARRHFEANVAHWRAKGDVRTRSAVGALVRLSDVAVVARDLTQACRLLAEALTLSETPGRGATLAYALESVAILAAEMHR